MASVFFAGINVGADSTAKAALGQQLKRVLVDITTSSWGSTLSSANWTTAAERVSSVRGVAEKEVISRGDTYIENDSFTSYKVVGISEVSRVYDGLNVTFGADQLEEYEAYVWVGSQDAQQLINSTLTLNFTALTFDYKEHTISLQLHVVGSASLDEVAHNIVLGRYQTHDDFVVSPQRRVEESESYYENLLVVSWEKTFAPLLDSAYTLELRYTPFHSDLLVFLDRESVINPWDIGASQEAVNLIVGQMNNVLAEFELTAYSNLQNALNTYSFLSLTLRVSFLVVALPVFFVAWYVGTTVSDVSFNLRRREIGLLLAKGFSSTQLFRLFLLESLLVGIIGGIAGVGLGFLFGPYFAPTIGGVSESSAPVLTLEVVVLTIVFGSAMTLLSTFRSSRKAAKLPAVDALKEHILVEEMKPYKKRWPWIALALGSYKIGMFLVGIPNLAQFFVGRPPPISNILLMILLIAWTAIDSALTPLGPLLFYWGLTKVLIRGSLRFQEFAAKTVKFLGDLGALATKNVQRNPARAASVAFLIALIIGYGFQTVVMLASEEDYIIRQVKAAVGADISVDLDFQANSTEALGNITGLSGVESVTIQYSFRGETSLHSLSIVAVEPAEWLSTAYYEDEWFTGNNVQTAFQHLADRNNTVILELGVAEDLNLQLGDAVTVTVDEVATSLEVVGFFGRQVSSSIQPFIGAQSQYYGARFWSITSATLMHSLDGALFAYEKVLVELEAGADEKNVAAQIRSFNSTQILRVQSVVEQLEKRESNLLLSGTAAIQRIGVVFAAFAGSAATALVMMVSLRERKREVAIMNVRGVSYRQLVVMLLSENLAIVVFAVTLGAAVGLVIANGSIAALNSTLFTLVTHHIVLPLDSIFILSTSIILVFALSIIPIVVMSKRYTSKPERIVRV